MKAQHYTDVPAQEAGADAVGVKIRWLIDEKCGAPNFAMRHFEVAPGGHTPFHSHEWEHEVYGLSGEGVVVGEQGEKPFRAGDYVFMPPHEKHQWRNTGSESLTMLCIVPLKK